MPTKVRTYDTAAPYVEALSPTGALLGTASPDQLIFRGHADVTWALFLTLPTSRSPLILAEN